MFQVFYVNIKVCQGKNCPSQGGCVIIAPENFAQFNSHCYVQQQPSNEKELGECQTALKSCPLRAIQSK